VSRARLDAIGAFIERPVPKTVVWKRADGDEVSFDCWIRRIEDLPYGVAEQFSGIDLRRLSKDEAAQLISETVCLDERGDELIGVTDALRMKRGLTLAFILAIAEVAVSSAKKAQPPTSSGTSSSSPASAAEPSPKPSAG
jgi:hypothetical protein